MRRHDRHGPTPRRPGRRPAAWALALGFAVGLGAQGLAHAQPESTEGRWEAARPHAEAGKKAYAERRFDDAVAAFEKAYEIDASPTLLFNIAQAHRHRGEPDKAIAFFQRYLMLSPRSKERDLVERRIRELEEQIRSGKTAAAATPAAATQPAPPSEPVVWHTTPAPAPATATANVDELAPMESEEIVAEIERSRRARASSNGVRLLFHGGLATPQFTGPVDYEPGVFFAGTLSAAYTLRSTRAAIDLGLSTSWSGLRFGDNRQSQLIGGFATIAGRFGNGGRFSAGPALSLGMIWWAGLERARPFPGATPNAIPMPSLQLGLPATWRYGAFVIGIEPAFSLSKTTSSIAVSSVSWFGLNVITGVEL